ncbi:MAG: DUF11 domain-containing protein [Micropruina sp.]|nr:DUF11 domain-containing protein [Micropruina sp.]
MLTNAAVPTELGGFCSDGSAPVDELCAAVVVPVTTYAVSKSASASSAVPGAKVTYTVAVTNTGGSAYTGATFSDALAGVLDDATYNNDAVASSGSVSLSGSTLSWTGDLVYPAVPVTITYSVTVNSPDTGDHVLTNAAVPTGPGGFCSDGSAPVDGLCAAVLVPVTTYAVSKAASASSVVPGGTVTYTITVTNTGGVRSRARRSPTTWRACWMTRSTTRMQWPPRVRFRCRVRPCRGRVTWSIPRCR